VDGVKLLQLAGHGCTEIHLSISPQPDSRLRALSGSSSGKSFDEQFHADPTPLSRRLPLQSPRQVKFNYTTSQLKCLRQGSRWRQRRRYLVDGKYGGRDGLSVPLPYPFLVTRFHLHWFGPGPVATQSVGWHTNRTQADLIKVYVGWCTNMYIRVALMKVHWI